MFKIKCTSCKKEFLWIDKAHDVTNCIFCQAPINNKELIAHDDLEMEGNEDEPQDEIIK